MPDVPKNGFFRSNLFIFLLGQSFAFLCWLIVFAFGWGKYSARFEDHEKRIGVIEEVQKRIDEHGTIFVQHMLEEQNKQLGEFRTRVERVEKDTSHFDVLEVEHQRLTKDVEELKEHAKK